MRIARDILHMFHDTTHKGSISVPLGIWCPNCGREREGGRCPNCDAWWMSPLLTVGGPLVALTLVGLAIAITLGNPNRDKSPFGTPTYAVQTRSTPLAVGGITPSNFYYAPAAVSPAAPMPALPPTPVLSLQAPPSPEIMRQRQAWQQHFALMQMSHQADAVVAAMPEPQSASVEPAAQMQPAASLGMDFTGI